MWPFRTKYKDDEIVSCAHSALEYETMLNATNLAVDSEKGIVTLSGKVRSVVDKNRATDAVHQGLVGANLKFDRIVDEIVIN